MSQPCDRAGNFRGNIVEYGLREEERGAVGISIKVALTQFWDGQEWLPWEQYDQVAEGVIYIVKSDGSVIERNVQALTLFAGWDQSLLSIEGQSWQPTPIGVSVTEEEFKNRKQIRASFINDYNRTPGALSNVTGEKIRELQNRFGGMLRAAAGNVKRTATPPPNGKPPAPPLPPLPPSNGSQHNPQPINAWTLDQAILECQNAGITKEELREAIAAKGHTGWNMIRDTPVAKELIEKAMAPAANNNDIPF